MDVLKNHPNTESYYNDLLLRVLAHTKQNLTATAIFKDILERIT
jgi:hypothetical protein